MKAENEDGPKQPAEFSYRRFNPAQQRVADVILRATTHDAAHRLFFVHGGCCTGKTHLLITLYYLLREQGYNVVNTSFLTTTAAELPNGTSTHHTFGITPLNEPATRFLGTPAEFRLANADVLIWDHAEGSDRSHLEIADDRLRRLTGDLEQPFGGRLIVILAADFANLGPMGCEQSPWKSILTARSEDGAQLLAHFRPLQLSHDPQFMNSRFFGVLQAVGLGRLREFYIPQPFVVKNRFLAHSVFYDAIQSGNFEAITRRVILVNANYQIGYWNAQAIRLLPAREIFESRAVDVCGGVQLEDIFGDYPRFPPRLLHLRQHTPLQLLSEAGGLQRGTFVQYLGVDRSEGDPQLECVVASGVKAGTAVRIPLVSSFNRADRFSRRQFPVTIAFAQTVNKAAGRRFERVGIDASRWRDNHGKLYTALSRVPALNAIRVADGWARNIRMRNAVATNLIPIFPPSHSQYK